MYLIHTHKPLIQPILLLAHRHDEMPRFRVGFTVAVIFAGVVLNLGIFAVLVGTHMAMDVIKYRSRYGLSWYWTAVETVRESLMDVFFIALGLLLALTLHHAVAIGGLGRLAQAEALLVNLIFRIAPRMKLAENILKVIVHWKHRFSWHFTPRTSLDHGERIMCIATLVMIGVIMILPFITSLSGQEVVETVQYEMTPRLEFGITKTIENAVGEELL